MWNVTISGTAPHPDFVVRERAFNMLVRHAPFFDSLTVPIAFWREGGNQMDDKNYVQAFYSYFFVIEDLYADGKTGERPVLKAFSESEEFCRICVSTLPRFFGKGDEHESALRRFFEAEGCQADRFGLQKFLFRMRGNLHHYFGKSPRPHPTPFNQQQFHSVALLALFIATLAIFEHILAIKRALRS